MINIFIIHWTWAYSIQVMHHRWPFKDWMHSDEKKKMLLHRLMSPSWQRSNTQKSLWLTGERLFIKLIILIFYLYLYLRLGIFSCMLTHFHFMCLKPAPVISSWWFLCINLRNSKMHKEKVVRNFYYLPDFNVQLNEFMRDSLLP